MNSINKIFFIFFIFYISIFAKEYLAFAQNIQGTQDSNITSNQNASTPSANKPIIKENTQQILVDPFSGSASSISTVDVSTNPDLANFVDQTLVGLVVGTEKKIAVMQSSTGIIGRYKKNEKINAEYKIVDISKDHIVIASLDKNEYQVYFNNVIKPVEKKSIRSSKPSQPTLSNEKKIISDNQTQLKSDSVPSNKENNQEKNRVNNNTKPINEKKVKETLEKKKAEGAKKIEKKNKVSRNKDDFYDPATNDIIKNKDETSTNETNNKSE
jgi:hypothetical protein